MNEQKIHFEAKKIEEIKLKLKNKDMDPDENKVAETGSDTTSADPPKSGSPPHWFITVGTRQ